MYEPAKSETITLQPLLFLSEIQALQFTHATLVSIFYGARQEDATLSLLCFKN
jgi:hypothetical protein